MTDDQSTEIQTENLRLRAAIAAMRTANLELTVKAKKRKDRIEELQVVVSNFKQICQLKAAYPLLGEDEAITAVKTRILSNENIVDNLRNNFAIIGSLLEAHFKLNFLSERFLLRLKRYDLGLNEFIAFYEAQDAKCAICKETFIRLKFDFDIDHEHSTGKVRGILCGHCNRSLGSMQDNAAICISAAYYLTKEPNVGDETK